MTTMSSGSTNSCPGIGRRRFGSPPERPTSRECPARGPYRTVTVVLLSLGLSDDRCREHQRESAQPAFFHRLLQPMVGCIQLSHDRCGEPWLGKGDMIKRVFC